MIYKIFRASEWDALCANGATQGAPIDLVDGFIHFSTAAQTGGTLAKHFSGVDNLILAAVDDSKLGATLKWEVSRGDALFPHLFRALRRDEVVWADAITLGPDGHCLPDRMQ